MFNVHVQQFPAPNGTRKWGKLCVIKYIMIIIIYLIMKILFSQNHNRIKMAAVGMADVQTVSKSTRTWIALRRVFSTTTPPKYGVQLRRKTSLVAG
jgi:hypothetical protein